MDEFPHKRGLRTMLSYAIIGMSITVLACTVEPIDETPADYEILACNPITGESSFQGPVLRRAMELAVKHISDDGGLLDGRLSLVHVDTHSQVQAAFQEASFYYEEHKNQIIGIAGAANDSVSRSLLVDIAKNKNDFGDRVPMISPVSSSPEFGLLIDQFDLFFRTVPSAMLAMRALSSKAKRLGYEKGTIIASDDKYGRDLSEAFQQAFDEVAPDDIVYEVRTHRLTSQKSVHQVVVDACAEDSDFLVILMGTSAKVLMTEWAKTKCTDQLILSDTLMSDAFFSSLDPQTRLALDGAQINGTFPAVTYSQDTYRRFATAFCGEYPSDCTCPPFRADCDLATEGRSPAYAANAYDSVFLLALAIEHAGLKNEDSVVRTSGWDFRAVVESLRHVTNDDNAEDVLIGPGDWALAKASLAAGKEVDYEGGTSSSLEFDLNGNLTVGDYLFWTLQDDQVKHTNSAGTVESIVISAD